MGGVFVIAKLKNTWGRERWVRRSYTSLWSVFLRLWFLKKIIHEVWGSGNWFSLKQLCAKYALETYCTPYEYLFLKIPCSVAVSSRNCSTTVLPVLHHLPEFAQTLVHWVVDAIQPSHPLLSPSPLDLNLSQHQGSLSITKTQCLLYNTPYRKAASLTFIVM